MSENEEPFEPGATYTIAMAARVTRIPEDQIVLYYRAGFVAPISAGDEADPIFDDQAIHQLRRIAFLLSEYHLHGEGLKMVATLLHEVEQLRREVRFLREQ